MLKTMAACVFNHLTILRRIQVLHIREFFSGCLRQVFLFLNSVLNIDEFAKVFKKNFFLCNSRIMLPPPRKVITHTQIMQKTDFIYPIRLVRSCFLHLPIHLSSAYQLWLLLSQSVSIYLNFIGILHQKYLLLRQVISLLINLAQSQIICFRMFFGLFYELPVLPLTLVSSQHCQNSVSMVILLFLIKVRWRNTVNGPKNSSSAMFLLFSQQWQRFKLNQNKDHVWYSGFMSS